jgi:uncharacterized circularly permuted ATP-grasp superfamily protein
MYGSAPAAPLVWALRLISCWPATAPHGLRALFDARSGGSGSAAYDEFVDTAGNVRPGWRELAEIVGERGRAGLDRLRVTVGALVDNDGITYIPIDESDRKTKRRGRAARNGHATGGPTPWQLDALPLLVTPEAWATLESGVLQRSRLLNAVLADLYGPCGSVAGEGPPAAAVRPSSYVRAARAIEVPGVHQLFMHGCDISGIRPVASGQRGLDAGTIGSRLRAGRSSCAARGHLRRSADPASRSRDVAVALLWPARPQKIRWCGAQPRHPPETAFDQAYLARCFPSWKAPTWSGREAVDAVVGTLKQVDVVLRPVDAGYVDPLDLRPDSMLGVVGLVEVLRRGAVTVVNTLGSGILESPGVMRFLPELSLQLLGETPLLPTAPLYWAGIDAERSHLLKHLSSLLIKSTTGGEPVAGPMLSSKQRQTLAARIEATPWPGVGQELLQCSTAPTDHYPGGLTAAGVGCDCSPFPTRRLPPDRRPGLRPCTGERGYGLNTIAAKDIWVRRDAGASRSHGFGRAGGRGEARRHSWRSRGCCPICSLGRYAERAEGTARLLMSLGSVTTPPPKGHRRRPVPAGAARRARASHRHRYCRRRRRDDTVVADRRPGASGIAGAVG